MRIWAVSDLHRPGGSPRRRLTMETHFGFRFDKMAETCDASGPAGRSCPVGQQIQPGRIRLVGQLSTLGRRVSVGKIGNSR